jgi:hypothetical protein
VAEPLPRPIEPPQFDLRLVRPFPRAKTFFFFFSLLPMGTTPKGYKDSSATPKLANMGVAEPPSWPSGQGQKWVKKKGFGHWGWFDHPHTGQFGCGCNFFF